MIVQRTGGRTFWTQPLRLGAVLQKDVDLALFQLQFHALHLPGTLDAKNATIQFSILHPTIVARGLDP